MTLSQKLTAFSEKLASIEQFQLSLDAFCFALEAKKMERTLDEIVADAQEDDLRARTPPPREPCRVYRGPWILRDAPGFAREGVRD